MTLESALVLVALLALDAAILWTGRKRKGR